MFTSFQTLPNEVLVQILLPLNGIDLQAACLISRGLNDVVSSILYRNLVWKASPKDKKWPAAAFQRRPWLRNAVRHIFIDDSDWSHDQMMKAAKHLSKFPLLTKIAWIRDWLPVHGGFEIYIQAVAQIHALEELHFPSFVLRDPKDSLLEGLSKLLNIKSLSFASEDTVHLVREWLELVKPDLVSWSISQVASPNYLFGCRNLQRLTLNHIRSFRDIESALANVNQLRELTLSFHYWALSLWNDKVSEPPRLSYLKTLRIHSDDMHSDILAQKRLCRLYLWVASDSQHLSELYYQFKFQSHGYHFETNGDIFINSILRHHRQHMRSFTLSDFYLTEPTLARVVHSCPQLQTLDFLSSSTHLDDIGPVIGNLQQLHTIRISIPGSFDNGFSGNSVPNLLSQAVQNLLQQTLTTVSRFYIRIVEGRTIRYGLWETQWTYDRDLQRPYRRIKYIQDYDENHKPSIGNVIESLP